MAAGNTRLERVFLEVPVAVVTVEKDIFVSKIGDENRRPAGVIVIAERNTH